MERDKFIEMEQRDPLRSPLNHKHIALLDAARSKDPDRIESLLREGVNANAQDSEDGNTPLHLALTLNCSCDTCIESTESCVAVLLNAPQVKVNVQNRLGLTPLHLAAYYQLEKCLDDLLFKGADAYISANDGTEALKLVANKMPDALCSILDKSVSIKNDHPRSESCAVTIDFRPLILSNSDSKGEPKNELDFLHCLQDSNKEVKEKIFLHPVTRIYLYQKWKRARFQIFASALFRLVWLLFYSSYIVLLYLVTCRGTSFGMKQEAVKMSNAEASVTKTSFPHEQNSTPSSGGSENACSEKLTFDTSFCFILGVTILEILYLLGHIVIRRKLYKLDLFHILVLAMAIGTFAPTFFQQSQLVSWQYELAAFTIFCAWASCLSVIGKFPTIGLSLEMFGHVLRRLWSILPTYLFLFIAFALAFCVLFPKVDQFSLLGFGLLKVIVMMSGEVEYDDMFYPNEGPANYSPISGHILYVVFVVVVVLVLMNLLVGLIVSDIQLLEKKAELSRISRQVTQMHHVESLLFSNAVPLFIQNVFQRICSLAPLLEKTETQQLCFTFKINDPQDHSVSNSLKTSILPLVIRNYNAKKLNTCPKRPRYYVNKLAIRSEDNNSVISAPGVQVIKTTTVVNERYVFA